MPPLREFQATRRNLPHWQRPGATYFLTWRVIDGRELAPDDRSIALTAIRFWDGKRWVVYSAVVMPDHAHALAQAAGGASDPGRAAVVMPDHAHALARPLPLDAENPCAAEFHNLSELTKSVKGYSSNAINSLQGRRGTLWQDESYDRIIRDDREFEDTWAYIRDNPVNAGLVTVPEEYPWLYRTERLD